MEKPIEPQPGDDVPEKQLNTACEITPEIREWAKQQFSEEEIADGLREIRQTGGLDLFDFIHELERACHE